jgi:NADP-dependent 3-hydroxy acid dehydrogenase YdfG
MLSVGGGAMDFVGGAASKVGGAVANTTNVMADKVVDTGRRASRVGEATIS